jgi:hypothetical protein
MSKNQHRTLSKATAQVLGGRAYAAIAAVEGLRLSAASKKRIASLRASNLTPEERRAEVVRAYSFLKGR